MKRRIPLLPLLVLVGAAAIGCERPPMETTQMNYRGLGIEQVQNPRLQAATLAENAAPAPQPPAAPGTPPASSVYKNLQVLGGLSLSEFNRLMVSITEWVSPEQGCNYCHAPENLASDEKYTKVVSRRMIQMTRYINDEWQTHVRQTGVTCYTCHRGQPLPAVVWSRDPAPQPPTTMVGNKAGQNHPAPSAGLTSLPYDAFTPFLSEAEEIRIQSTTALPTGDRRSIKETEWTYGLMVHISESLGVNCTYCHNSRSFMPWEASSPARVNAWYAIRMVRHVNNDFIGSVANVLPVNRKGPAGDVLKVNCGTCHRGLPKPLNGANLLQHYPELGGTQPTRVSLTHPSPSSRPLQSAPQ